MTSTPLMASTAWPTAGTGTATATARPQSPPAAPARPGPPAARRRRTADAIALPEGHDDALVVRAQDEVEREAEGLLGVGAGRVVVELVDEAARLVHHVHAEDRHGAPPRPAPEAASRRAPVPPLRTGPPHAAREALPFRADILQEQPPPRHGETGRPRGRRGDAGGAGGARGGGSGLLRAGSTGGAPSPRAAADRPVPLPPQPPKDDKKKKDAGKSAKKDKDPVNKSGGKAKKKVGAGAACAGGPGAGRGQRGHTPSTAKGCGTLAARGRPRGPWAFPVRGAAGAGVGAAGGGRLVPREERFVQRDGVQSEQQKALILSFGFRRVTCAGRSLLCKDAFASLVGSLVWVGHAGVCWCGSSGILRLPPLPLPGRWLRARFPLLEQKWSKGKVRDKLNNLVLFDKATYDKLCKEVPNYKLITPAVVSERLKIRGSLARAALQELLSKGEAQNWDRERPQSGAFPCSPRRFRAMSQVRKLLWL